jgi:hypothetical protein
MAARLRGQLDALQTLCERIECTRLGIRGPNPAPPFFFYAGVVRRLVALLVGNLEPAFILRPEIRHEARRFVIMVASVIIYAEVIGDNEALEENAAEIRADRRMQERVHSKVHNTFDHVLNEWTGVEQINHGFKARFAAAVVLEEIFRDALHVSFVLDVRVPWAIHNQAQLPLTLALSQVWSTCSPHRGYQSFVNFLRLVKSAIAPGTIVEFEEGLRDTNDEFGTPVTAAEAQAQLERCIRESGVDD